MVMIFIYMGYYELAAVLRFPVLLGPFLCHSFSSRGDRSSFSFLCTILFIMAITESIAVAFNVIETIGFVSALAIIITAALSSSIRRLPTWYLVLCSGAVYSFSKLLLAMAHAQFGPEPQFMLCLVQGALIYSAPIW